MYNSTQLNFIYAQVYTNTTWGIPTHGIDAKSETDCLPC